MSNHPSRRRFLAALAFAGVTGLASLAGGGCGPSCSCTSPVPEGAPVTVYIVRHAEKQDLPATAPEAERKNPPLSADGAMRAMGLTEDIPVKDIEAVYVTDTKRSRDTASAVMAVNGVKPIVYPPHDVDGLAYRLKKRHGQSALVVGHSNTIPPLLTALGVSPAIEVGEDQYGDLWIVTVDGDTATLEVRRFGESIDRFNPGSGPGAGPGAGADRG